MDLLPFQPVSVTFFSLALPFPFFCAASRHAALITSHRAILPYLFLHGTNPIQKSIRIFPLSLRYLFHGGSVCSSLDIGAILKPIGGFVSRDARQTDTLFRTAPRQGAAICTSSGLERSIVLVYPQHL
jgi:hypothetical protein